MMKQTYETVIGLEVHVELATRSKIFCGCPTRFGAASNTQACPVCAGLPGALPFLNREAVALALRAALALDCRITPVTRFDRKHYFYPDLPKAFQISQFYAPLATGGAVMVESPDGADTGSPAGLMDTSGKAGAHRGKRIRIHELHIEEDAGKLVHDPWTDSTLIDFNRCGVPLIEIVSEPDLRSAAEAVAYLEALTAILQHAGVSDCRMEEGSIRADINLSVRPAGSTTLGTRTEMKNMNSLKAIARAIDSESARQCALLAAGKPVVQETRRWDDSKGRSLAMRSKENAPDYQYFPDPDLPPIAITALEIEAVRASLPELPASRRARFISGYGLSAADAALLVASPRLAAWFEAVGAACGSHADAAAWILTDVFKWLNQTGRTIDSLDTPPGQLARLIVLTRSGRITRETARGLLPRVLAERADPDVLVAREGLASLADPEMIAAAVDAVLAAEPKAVAEYLAGSEKVFSYLTGQAMRALKGKSPAPLVRQCLQERLSRPET